MRQRIFSWARKRSAPRGKSSGQSIVELGLMLPILALVIVGVVDLGRIYYAYITVVNVAREGARYAAAHPLTSCSPGLDAAGLAAIDARARNEAAASGISPGQLEVVVSCYYEDNHPFENPITVTVWYRFQMLSGYFLNFPPIRLRSDVTMQVFGR